MRKVCRCPAAKTVREVKALNGGAAHPVAMNFDTSEILIVVVASAVGFGYFRYGRKQQLLIPTLCGIGLMGYPYLIHGTFWLLGLGVALMAGPFLFRP